MENIPEIARIQLVDKFSLEKKKNPFGSFGLFSTNIQLENGEQYSATMIGNKIYIMPVEYCSKR